MEPLDYCSNFLIGGYNSDGSTRLYSLVEEDELLASIRGRIMKKIALINPPFRGVIHRINDSRHQPKCNRFLKTNAEPNPCLYDNV